MCISSKFAYSNNKIWRRQWHPTPVLLPGRSHGWRSLVGCSPWGRWRSDTTERLHFHFSLSSIGEENGNPLQCSCLENPRDGGARWAAVYGVTQSRTRLKWLSSSSSSSNKINNNDRKKPPKRETEQRDVSNGIWNDDHHTTEETGQGELIQVTLRLNTLRL